MNIKHPGHERRSVSASAREISASQLQSHSDLMGATGTYWDQKNVKPGTRLCTGLYGLLPPITPYYGFVRPKKEKGTTQRLSKLVRTQWRPLTIPSTVAGRGKQMCFSFGFLAGRLPSTTND